MRIVDKETFMKMPRNTVFATTDGVDKALVGELSVKGANFGKSDFYYTPLTTLHPSHTDEVELCDAYEKMRINPDVHMPGNLSECRYGYVDDSVKFIVYDRHEINQIIKMLQNALKKLDKIDPEESQDEN